MCQGFSERFQSFAKSLERLIERILRANKPAENTEKTCKIEKAHAPSLLAQILNGQTFLAKASRAKQGQQIEHSMPFTKPAPFLGFSLKNACELFWSFNSQFRPCPAKVKSDKFKSF